ncbi:MAG: DUF4271 domain-containing protein [Bacteroidota bacterium]
MRTCRLLILFLFCGCFLADLPAQQPFDSSAVLIRDTVRRMGSDSSSVQRAIAPGQTRDTLANEWGGHIPLEPYSPYGIWDSLRAVPPGSIWVRESDRHLGEAHVSKGKEGLFYALLGMVFLLALFRRFFPKYWTDLFRLFFRTTLRQRQLRDQLQLASLPSLLLNIFFFLCIAFYLSLFLTNRGWNPFQGFWTLWFLLLLGVVIMYFVKWLGLQFASWVFGQKELGDDYSFLVFTVNKVMGLMLLPSVIGMAFGVAGIGRGALELSWFLIGGLLLYRGYLTYRVVRRQALVSPLHFFLYWLGFEVAPLLVLYRFLLGFFSEMT